MNHHPLRHRRPAGSKLRLKRPRRQQEELQQQQQEEEEEEEEGGQREPPPAPAGSRPPLTLGSSPAWFRKQDLSSTERTWATLLTAADPDLDFSRLENVASFPPFLPKSVQVPIPRPTPEPFYVGTKQFEWAPFPRYGRENAQGKGSGSRETETVGFTPRENKESDGSKVVSCGLEPTALTATHGPTLEGSRAKHNAKVPAKLEGEAGMGTGGLPLRLDSGGPPSSTAAQLHEKMADVRRLEDGSATREQQRKNEGLLKDYTLAPSTSSAQGLPSAGFSEREKAKNRDDKEFPDLDQCPMCQMLFSGTWSRLDIDSHLAKCLSESTEDVAW